MAQLTYEKLGITKSQIIEMQHWLYPIIADPNAPDSVATTIQEIIKKYNGAMRQYTLYHFGHIIGEAREKQKHGSPLVLKFDDL